MDRKKSNANFAQDIINQRKELESEPPTTDELAEVAAATYLARKAKKQLPIFSQEQWEVFFKKALTATSQSHADENKDFMENIPEIHRSWWAIKEVGRSERLAKLYALVMTKVYRQESFPFEIEKIILALDGEELIWQLAKKDYTWSHRAQHIMRCLHPEAYKKVFAENPQRMAIIFA